ncbi:flagellin [Haloimpatiens massiliensis]|uniref:flagellin N-terminal helical domain-containing protein n=1 Tax=Haloimpatiens massiliensis TaxID=1658110 RepID=UPI000C8253EE|nr:flagellin [Haloimpatiens massiliensis]
MRLMHNLASLNIYRNYSRTLERQSVSMGKISSGYKINGAKEEANDLAKSERMRMSIRGLNIASRNAQDGVSMLQTAEGGMENMTSILQRVRELTVKYNNGTNSNNDKSIIQEEINELINAYDGICENTEFNGKKLLSRTETIETTIGSECGENLKIELKDLRSGSIKNGDIKLEDLKEIYDKNIDSNKSIEILDYSIDTLVKARSQYGALENRLGSTMDRLVEIKDRVQGAESEIRDTDIAEEALSVARDNILIEASNAMMVQSNKFPQDVLKILENVRSK